MSAWWHLADSAPAGRDVRYLHQCGPLQAIPTVKYLWAAESILGGCKPLIWTYFRASRSQWSRVRYRWLRAAATTLSVSQLMRPSLRWSAFGHLTDVRNGRSVGLRLTQGGLCRRRGVLCSFHAVRQISRDGLKYQHRRQSQHESHTGDIGSRGEEDARCGAGIRTVSSQRQWHQHTE